MDDYSRTSKCKFQSTRSARSATIIIHFLTLRKQDFNPRAPRGARLMSYPALAFAIRFQSTRSARSATKIQSIISPFYIITTPARREVRAVPVTLAEANAFVISIHALREERDRRLPQS